jgi:hypothetical protein
MEKSYDKCTKEKKHHRKLNGENEKTSEDKYVTAVYLQQKELLKTICQYTITIFIAGSKGNMLTDISYK